MKRQLLTVGLAMLSLNAFADEFGIGATANFNNQNQSSTSGSTNVTSTQNTYNPGISGEYSFGDGWAIDPYVALNITTNAASANNTNVTDGQITWTYTFGLTGYKTLFSAGQLKLLSGLGASYYFSNQNMPQTATYSQTNYSSRGTSGYGFAVVVPLAADYRITPNISLRVGTALAGYGYSSTTATNSYTNSGTTTTTTTNTTSNNIFFIPGNLGACRT